MVSCASTLHAVSRARHLLTTAARPRRPALAVLASSAAFSRMSTPVSFLLHIHASCVKSVRLLAQFAAGSVGVVQCEGDVVRRCLPHIQRNAQVNGVEVETTLFDWFQPQQSEVMLDIDEWDTICLADVMYEDIFVQPVAKAVRNLLRQNRNSTVWVPAANR